MKQSMIIKENEKEIEILLQLQLLLLTMMMRGHGSWACFVICECVPYPTRMHSIEPRDSMIGYAEKICRDLHFTTSELASPAVLAKTIVLKLNFSFEKLLLVTQWKHHSDSSRPCSCITPTLASFPIHAHCISLCIPFT